MVHRLTLMERQVAITAIDRTTRGIHQVAHTVVPAALKDVAKAHQIALDVHRRILKRVAHASLSRQIDHNIRFLFGEESHEGRAVFQSHSLEAPGS